MSRTAVSRPSSLRHCLAAILLCAPLAAAVAADAPAGAETDPVKAGYMAGWPVPADRLVSTRNWLEFPANRWAFRNMASVFRTGTVLRGQGPVGELPRGARLDVAALRFTDHEGASITAAEYFRRESIDGFIVMQRGKVIYEGYFDSMQAEQRHLWQSMTKSLTGLMAEMLAHQGKLDLTRTAGDYLPELRETVWGRATLRHLLDMSVAAKEPSTRAAEQPADLWETIDFGKQLRSDGAEQSGENGRLFYYTNSAPTTIGLVMTRVTGKSWHALAHDLIWSKIGAQGDADIWLDVTGQGAAAGGFSSTLRDAARFGELIRNEGRYQGRQVVPREVVARLRRDAGNAAEAAVGNVALVKVRPGMAYKSYWYQVNDGAGTLEALGIFGQHLHVNPAAQLTVVQFGSYRTPAPNPANWSRLIETITRSLPAR